ncbi:uncharacterized protein [Ptychodera flava]|uniref:uncharacterized protein n=1 Tax=Ptychodera flava TaxID=63121 RepID=UPI00396AA26E
MLGTLNTKEKQHWSQHISFLVHAYNCTRNDATQFSPYYLMFGREARLPIDLCFGVSPDEYTKHDYLQYVEDLKSRLKGAYELAENEAKKKALANKRRYDSKVRGSDLLVGDRVLIRNVGLIGKHKLADRWKPDVHVVEKRLDDNLPVYVVKPETGNGVERTLHRNMLLPIGYLSASEPEEVEIEERRPVTRQSARQQTDKKEDTDTDSDMEELFANPPIPKASPIVTDDNDISTIETAADPTDTTDVPDEKETHQSEVEIKPQPPKKGQQKRQNAGRY